MNKLVSKNPVQRFREGKQIKKFQNPSQPIYLMDNNRNKYQLNSDGKYYRTDDSDAFSSGKTAKEINDTKKGQIAISEKLAKIPLGGIAAVKESIYNRKPSDSKDGKSIGNKSKGIGSNLSYQFGKMGGWNRSIGEKTIDDLESLNMIKEMGIEGASAQDIQNKINEKFGSNAVKVDNKWGNQSRAGLKALYDDWKMNRPETNSFQQKLISQLPNLDFKSVIPENISMREQIAMDGYKPSDVDQHLINISNTITNKTPTYVTANRSETRDWMRSNGINPYSVTGAMRAAARRLRAGQANDNDKLLVKGNEQLYNLLKGYFKKGGLISRNPIERFKSNFR